MINILLISNCRRIIFVDYSHPAKIESANFDGTDRRTLISDGLSHPRDIAVDQSEGTNMLKKGQNWVLFYPTGFCSFVKTFWVDNPGLVYFYRNK